MLDTDRRVLDMYFYGLIILVQSVNCVEFNLNGDLKLDFKIESIGDRKTFYLRGNGTEMSEPLQDVQTPSTKSTTTKPECSYHFPRTKEVNTLLSNMMNILTKIFTRARELSKKQEQWRVRAHDARFRVVSTKYSEYFDLIYSNMTQKFKTFYQRASGDLISRRWDPCEQQSAAKILWRGLLRRSEDELKDAAVEIIEHQLQMTQHSDESRLRRKLYKFLREEMRKVRARQLDWICQHRWECYKELS